MDFTVRLINNSLGPEPESVQLGIDPATIGQHFDHSGPVNSWRLPVPYHNYFILSDGQPPGAPDPDIIWSVWLTDEAGDSAPEEVQLVTAFDAAGDLFPISGRVTAYKVPPLPGGTFGLLFLPMESPTD